MAVVRSDAASDPAGKLGKRIASTYRLAGAIDENPVDQLALLGLTPLDQRPDEREQTVARGALRGDDAPALGSEVGAGVFVVGLGLVAGPLGAVAMPPVAAVPMPVVAPGPGLGAAATAGRSLAAGLLTSPAMLAVERRIEQQLGALQAVIEGIHGTVQLNLGLPDLGDLPVDHHQRAAFTGLVAQGHLAHLEHPRSPGLADDALLHQDAFGRVPGLFVLQDARHVRLAVGWPLAGHLAIGLAVPVETLQLETPLASFVGDQPAALPVLEEDGVWNGLDQGRQVVLADALGLLAAPALGDVLQGADTALGAAVPVEHDIELAVDPAHIGPDQDAELHVIALPLDGLAPTLLELDPILGVHMVHEDLQAHRAAQRHAKDTVRLVGPNHRTLSCEPPLRQVLRPTAHAPHGLRPPQIALAGLQLGRAHRHQRLQLPLVRAQVAKQPGQQPQRTTGHHGGNEPAGHAPGGNPALHRSEAGLAAGARLAVPDRPRAQRQREQKHQNRAPALQK